MASRDRMCCVVVFVCVCVCEVFRIDANLKPQNNKCLPSKGTDRIIYTIAEYYLQYYTVIKQATSTKVKPSPSQATLAHLKCKFSNMWEIFGREKF